MSTIPLPALDLKPPAPPVNPLQEFAQVSALKGQIQQQQIQQQDLQIKQQQAQDLQATTKAMNEWNASSGDYDALAKKIGEYGGSANAQMGAQQHGIAVRQAQSKLTTEQLAAVEQKHKLLGDRLNVLSDPTVVPDEQLHAKSLDAVVGATNDGLIDQQHAQPLVQQIQQTNDPAALRTMITQFSKTIQGAAAIAAQQKEKAQTEEASGKGREANANATLKEIEAKGLQGITPDYINQTAQDPITKQQALNALARGDVMGAKEALKEGFQSALGQQKDIAVATNPAVQSAKLHLATAEKSAEQAIADGDPKAAAKLLIDGTVAPSQLISSRKPAFAQQAFSEAAKMQPGWSAPKADADYKVASSSGNLGFFGSAKSLTDKGGTLDQLKDAAKDIPEGKIPVFNSIQDAIQAQTGGGPIAKYAALALGVADDYSKVMGGGQGSDTSRSQALKIISAKQSPEQKAEALEGIRGAVMSQTKSRIGNNAVLQKMYGDESAQPAQSAPKTGQSKASKYGVEIQ